MEPKTGTPRWTCSKVTVVPYRLDLTPVWCSWPGVAPNAAAYSVEVVARLVGGTQGGPGRVGGAEVTGPGDADEPDLAGRGLGSEGDRALGLGLHLLDQALAGREGGIGGGGRLGQSDACEAGADECETTCLAEDLHLLSLPET